MDLFALTGNRLREQAKYYTGSDVYSLFPGLYFALSGLLNLKMSRIKTNIFFSVAAVLLLGLSTTADDVITDWDVQVEGTLVKITWSATNESTVDRYEVYREFARTNGPTILEQCTQYEVGKGNYSCEDHGLYKSGAQEQAIYTITAVLKNGEKESKYRYVNYTTTAVRRTWGSIKAMFQ